MSKGSVTYYITNRHRQSNTTRLFLVQNILIEAQLSFPKFMKRPTDGKICTVPYSVKMSFVHVEI